MKYPFYLISGNYPQSLMKAANMRLTKDQWNNIPYCDDCERTGLRGHHVYGHQLIGDFSDEEIYKLTIAKKESKDMKQDIICLGCKDILKVRYGDDLEPYPGEYLKYVEGRAIGQYKCDHCGCEIQPLTRFCAYSVSTKNAPYSPWEHEYIITGGES